MKIFCIIPAYNEEKTIIEVINSVKPLVDQVAVVDDGSTDKTFELATEQIGAADSEAPNLPLAVVLHHIINRGQGAALKTGTEYALRNGADIIIHFDADEQFLADDIASIVQPIKNGIADVVFGSRFLNKKSNMPFLKKNLILPLAKIVSRIFFNIKMTDPQSGFRAMSARVARKIDWQQDQMAHCSEILFAVNQAGCKIKEVPITVIYHSFGQRFFDGFKILKDLFLAKIVN
ncbi:MAG: glycosyltransferase family 2 protein [Patescibacteria group bacterium]|nr:glycosyltransferase family 2 protein [Patescibacteria group bacterium]